MQIKDVVALTWALNCFKNSKHVGVCILLRKLYSSS